MTSHRVKLNNLKLKIGSLLTEKKAFHSKVVCQEYDRFLESTGEILLGKGDPAEIKRNLNELEKALKQEGLYKLMKPEFVAIKQPFLTSLKVPLSQEEDDTVSEHKASVRTTTATISRQSYVKDLESQKSTPTYVPVALSELKNMRRAVGDLFQHLETNRSDRASPSHKQNAKSQNKGSSEEEEFQNILHKIKQFDNELSRQKASQHTELLRLLDENKDLKSKAEDLRTENERFKGIHPISQTAMDKTVEKIEQHYITQKRDFEGKIVEIENELHTSLEKTLKEKESLEHMMQEGLTQLKSGITSLHQRVIGRDIYSTTPDLHHHRNDKKKPNIDGMIRCINDIEEEVVVLQRRNKELFRILRDKESDIRDLRGSLNEITSEINKTHEAVSSTEGQRRGIIKLPPMDTSDNLHDIDSFINKLRDIEETAKHYIKSLGEENSKKSRDDLRPLKSKINKIYDDLLKIVNPADIPGFTYQKDFDLFLLKAGRERSDDVNQLLRKLSRIENVCQQLLSKKINTEGL